MRFEKELPNTSIPKRVEVTQDNSSKTGQPTHKKSVETQSFNALFFLLVCKNASLSVGCPLRKKKRGCCITSPLDRSFLDTEKS